MGRWEPLMHLTAGRARRGQTFPFWVISTVLGLTLVFFVANYTNTMRWELRAQNAADTAASAAISTDANMNNELSTLMYASAIEEVRLRYLNQAILNTINGVGGCDPAPGQSCDQDYQSLVSAYNTASSNYATLVQLMRQADNFTQGGQKNGPWKAMGLIGSDCSIFDCAFTVTPLDVSAGPGSAETVDVVACKNVPTLVPQLLGLGAGSSFQALGRSAETLTSVNESFNPSTVNPRTGQPYQPAEPQWATYPFSAYTVDFSNVTVNLSWDVAGPTKPYAVYPSGGVSCS
ncbi:hypothetical protein EPN44_15195 [bacterium]|nr:MAG: hypothetical protein EPN44_15195 [bacterium]